MINEPVQHSDLEQLLADDKAEWAESLDAIVAQYGAAGARGDLPQPAKSCAWSEHPLRRGNPQHAVSQHHCPGRTAGLSRRQSVDLEEKINCCWNAIANG